MIRKTSPTMRFAESRYVELASLQRSVGSSNRRLQDKEIAIRPSAFGSCGGVHRSCRYSRFCNCEFFQLPLHRVAAV